MSSHFGFIFFQLFQKSYETCVDSLIFYLQLICASCRIERRVYFHQCATRQMHCFKGRIFQPDRKASIQYNKTKVFASSIHTFDHFIHGLACYSQVMLDIAAIDSKMHFIPNCDTHQPSIEYLKHRYRLNALPVIQRMAGYSGHIVFKRSHSVFR